MSAFNVQIYVITVPVPAHRKEDVKTMAKYILRYGLPYYAIHQLYGKFEWSFADEIMNEIMGLNIVFILGLMHFVVPDWIGNYQKPELPCKFCRCKFYLNHFLS